MYSYLTIVLTYNILYSYCCNIATDFSKITLELARPDQ